MIVRHLVALLMLVASVASAQDALRQPAAASAKVGDILISRQLAKERGLTVGSVVQLATDATLFHTFPTINPSPSLTHWLRSTPARAKREGAAQVACCDRGNKSMGRSRRTGPNDYVRLE